MDITVNSQLLAQELRLLHKVVASKPAIPILSNVRIDVTDTLRMFATDLEIAFYTRCKAAVHRAGSITVNISRFRDMVEQFPDADVRLTVDKHFLKVVCGSFVSKLQTLPADDFVMPHDVAEGDTRYELPADVFNTMIARARYAIAEKGQKHFMHGALLAIKSNFLALVATDGKRLSLATAARSNANETEAILPAKTLDALASFDYSDVLVFSHSDMNLFFQMGERLFISRMFDGKFPAYERIIPKEHTRSAVVKRSTLIQTIKRISLVSTDAKQIYLKFMNGALHVRAMNVDVGEADEVIPIVYEGDDLQLSLNWEHLLDFLNAASSESIKMQMRSAQEAVLLTDSNEFLNVVMTLRV